MSWIIVMMLGTIGKFFFIFGIVWPLLMFYSCALFRTFDLLLWWCRESVKQSCKNVLTMLVSWYYFSGLCWFLGRAEKPCHYVSRAIFVYFVLWIWRNSCLQTLTTLIVFTPNTNNPNTKYMRTELDWYPSFMYPKENVNDIISWWEATKGWACKRL